MNLNSFEKKIRISGKLRFETAFHIGSGKEGELATDMGVLKNNQGLPVLPGSTLKGNFRSLAEKLSGCLGLSACLMDSSLSNIDCIGDQDSFRKHNEEFKNLKNEKEKIEWLKEHTCHVCKLFGSPLQSSRIFFSDGKLLQWSGSYNVRDGVVIDRDSGTARHGLKFDYEIADANTVFEMNIQVENPEKYELALIGATLSEWQSGFRLGGFSSRGLGQVKLFEVRIEQVDFSNPEHTKNYLLKRKMQPAENILNDAMNDIFCQKEA